MERIVLDHKDYEIKYHEDDNTWACFELGFTGTSLQAVRKKIDTFLLDSRRVSGVRVMALAGYHAAGRGAIFSVTSIAEPNATGQTPTAVWVNSEATKTIKAKREKLGLHTLVLANDENLALIAALEERTKRIQAEERAIAEGFKAIPRVTLADLGVA